MKKAFMLTGAAGRNMMATVGGRIIVCTTEEEERFILDSPGWKLVDLEDPASYITVSEWRGK